MSQTESGVDRDEWLHGGCFPFAEALALLTGWQPIILWSHERDEDGNEVSVTIHSAVRHPNGEYVDAAGLVTEDQMLERYEYNVPEIADTTIGEMHQVSRYGKRVLEEAQKAIKMLAEEDDFFKDLIVSQTTEKEIHET